MGQGGKKERVGGNTGAGFRKLGYQFTEDLLRQSEPGRRLAFQTASQLLANGGAANSSEVGRAVEQFRFQQGQRKQSVEDQLRTTGLAGTPFGIRTLAEFEQEAGLGERGVRENVENQALARFLSLIGVNLGAAGVASQPFTQAGLTGAAIQSGDLGREFSLTAGKSGNKGKGGGNATA